MRRKTTQVIVTMFLSLVPILASADSGYYREMPNAQVYYGSEMYMVSNGQGSYYRYIDGKYYPVPTTYGSTYGYGGQYQYKKPKDLNPNYKLRNPTEKKQVRKKKNNSANYASSKDYPIYFDE